MRSQLVSVIIPAHNEEKFIKMSLDSLKYQTYGNYEAIIVDDGSTDNTSVIAKKYANTDSRFMYNYQDNTGVSMARNRGLDLSKGKYICFLDADDYLGDTFLEKLYNRIEEKKDDVCYCGYNILYNNLVKRRKTKFKNGDILFDRLSGRINVSAHGWMIRKKHLDKNNIRFEKGVSWGEDFKFFNEVVATTDNVSCVAEHLVNYRVGHSKGQLSNFSLDKIDRDYQSIMASVNNKRVNKNKKIEGILVNYRLHGAIIYRLVSAINIGVDRTEIQIYYNRYSRYINKWTFNNGLRSVKLNLNRLRLIAKMG